MSGSLLDANQIIKDAFSDSKGALQVAPVAGGTLVTGQKTVTTANTAVQLATTTGISSVVIKAKASNAGKCYIGVSGVTTSSGFELAASESITLIISALSTIYVNADTDAQVVCFAAS